MRVAFIGCVEMSELLLQVVLKHPVTEVVGVVTRDRSPINADLRTLQPLADAHDLSCFVVEGNNQAAMVAWLRDREPDVVCCFGWSYLLGPDVLALAPKGVVGYHPTLLPVNRGRHPIVWAIALGLDETGSTFFAMDEGADTGDILHQELVPIAPDETARTLYDKLADVAASQLSELLAALADGTVEPREQNHTQANSWRRRSDEDGRIDWRMSAGAIYRLVRALTQPYVGAHVDRDGTDQKVWAVEVMGAAPANLEPGKVLAVQADLVTVKVDDGAVRLVDHELDPIPAEGDYL